jgi:hypothetical protein
LRSATSDPRLLRFELLADIVLGDLDALLFQAVAGGQRIGLDGRLLEYQAGDETVLCEVLVDFLLEASLLVVGVDGGGRGALVEPFGLEPRIEAREIGLGPQEQLLGFVQQLPRLRVVEHEHDGVRRDGGAGPQHDALDATLRGGRDPYPRVVQWDERAEPSHLPEHGAALHGVYPDGGTFNGGRRRLEPSQDHRDEPHHEQTCDGERHLLELLLPRHGGWSLNVHERIALLTPELTG